MARLGIFGRIGKAVSNIADSIADIFKPKESRRAKPTPEPKPKPAPTTGGGRGGRDRQKRRERDPYLDTFNGLGGATGGYLAHKDFFDEISGPLDLDPDEKLELWEDYLRYMTRSNPGYRLSDLANPWWSISNIHPDDFDWHGWRDAMGYPHGNRKG